MGSDLVPLNYLPILFFIGIALAFGVVSLLAGWVVRPSKPYRAKLAPYESGSPLFSDARVPFPMRYYVIAMLFVIFDIEIVFLFAWAVRFHDLGWYGVGAVGVFTLLLIETLVYVWKRGALDWNVAHRRRRVVDQQLREAA